MMWKKDVPNWIKPYVVAALAVFCFATIITLLGMILRNKTMSLIALGNMMLMFVVLLLTIYKTQNHK